MKMSVALGVACVLAGAWGIAERPSLVDAEPAGAAWFSAHAAPAGGEVPRPQWAIDPAQPGPDLPPAGRSLFDFVTVKTGEGEATYDIPFPFEALVRRIEERAGCAPPAAPCTRQVLIPLGRSLQRTAATPDFFTYPRVVVAVDRDGAAGGRAGMMLRDRLYLGYQEKANLIEVISYNEAAGRFEFQLVKDYRAGGKPRVVYANRNVCIACHQNHAPLFSRQQWDETNANPRVAARLAQAQRTFYGVPIRGGTEIPNAIDDATDRANMLSTLQLLWREGCGEQEPDGARCRAGALMAALQYRLSGERGFDRTAPDYREAVTATLARNAAVRWPGGLAIPNPDIPNRDPLAFPDGTTVRAMSHVIAGLEPLAPRPPLAMWPANDPDLARRFVTGLAGTFAGADVREIDGALARLAAKGGAPRQTLAAKCELRTWESEVRFHCRPLDPARGAALEGRFVQRGDSVDSGELISLAAGSGEPSRHLEIREARVRQAGGETALSFAPLSRGLRARLPDGTAIEGIEMRWGNDGTGDATVTLVDDLGPLRRALSAMVSENGNEGPLDAAVFSRTRIMGSIGKRLGLASMPSCCEDARGFPPAEEDADPAGSGETTPTAVVFKRHCAPCHQTPEPFPPNFLHGDAQRVTAALASCAPRIYVRLAMWDVKRKDRDKTPMPPALASRGGAPADAEYGPDPAVVATLRDAALDMVRAGTGAVPDLDAMLARGYENLRPCLPGGLMTPVLMP